MNKPLRCFTNSVASAEKLLLINGALHCSNKAICGPHKKELATPALKVQEEIGYNGG